ncbi:MAG: spore maturation protein [Gammaproteobacteria bacterium]|nr:spore maturation protein [Gammaproteobacteria bacterium]
MEAITNASFESAKDAVTLSIGMIGVMAFWLGLVRILEAGGFMVALAQKIKPLMVRLFPDVPPNHPAMSAMMLNVSANMLGLGNAATPLGLKAMVELNKLNPIPGTATNAMCLFLAIITSSVTLLPLGVIGVRSAAGSVNPAEITLPTLIATIASTLVGILVALWLAKRDHSYKKQVQEISGELRLEQASGPPSAECELNQKFTEDSSHLVGAPCSFISKIFIWGICIALFMAVPLYLTTTHDSAGQIFQQLTTYWLIPILILLVLLYGLGRGVKIYEAITEGAKQGFEVAIRIIPFLVAILVAVGMFRASGAMELLVSLLQPITGLIGMPAETLPMALIRPLSGSGAFGVMSALVEAAPNSYSAFVASVMQGSTDTTLYILAIYFGSVGINTIRHALVAGLLADFTGLTLSCLASSWFYVPM